MTTKVQKWIRFSVSRKSESGKTRIWKVLSNDDDSLGEVRWYGRWRKYAFHPEIFTVYEQDCLRKIADFCENESKKLRKSWGRKKGS